MIKVSKSTKRGFSKKALMGFNKLFLFWDCMNPLNAWQGKLEVANFFYCLNPCTDSLLHSLLGALYWKEKYKVLKRKGPATSRKRSQKTSAKQSFGKLSFIDIRDVRFILKRNWLLQQNFSLVELLDCIKKFVKLRTLSRFWPQYFKGQF